MSTATNATITTPTTTPSSATRHRTLAVILGAPTVILTLLVVMVAPILNSGPSALPIAVAGPPPAMSTLTETLGNKMPDAFAFSTHDSPAAATESVRDRESVGAIIASPNGITVIKASGAGAPYGQLLDGLATQLRTSGQQVTMTDVAPLPPEDPAGMSVTALALPLTIGALLPGILLTLLVRGNPLRHIAIIGGIATLAGFGAAAILQFGFGALAGNYWLTGLAIGAGILAGSSLTVGLGAVLGQAGLSLGSILMLFVANPLSGMATGPQWLPTPWGAFGQFLPVGAAGTAIRSAAYFDGAGATWAWVVLASWALCGLALAAFATRNQSRH